MLGRLFPLCAAMLAMVAAFPQASGCLNEYRPNLAARQRSSSLVQQLTDHPVAEEWTVRRDRLRTVLAQGGDFRVKNDLATSLLHTGEAEEAVKLLTEVEAEKPDLYFTAANLGTAYELSGNNAQALEWIQEGIKRNPEAHEGTEWLHVKILQAKIAVAADPKWLETHSVLTSELAKDPQKNFGNRGEELSSEQVKTALIYQLHERLQFVPPPDAIVGDLLLDLFGLVSAEQFGMPAGRGVLRIAAQYLSGLEPTHPLRHSLNLHRTMLKFLSERVPSGATIYWPGIFGTLVLGVVLGLVVVRLLRKSRRSAGRA